MKSAKRWLFMAATVLLLSLLACSEAALPFKKVSIAKTPASTSSTSTTSTTTEDTAVEEENTPVPEGSSNSDVPKAENNTRSSTKNSKLTGIPQIDYIWDPNLPRELNGYNLSSYPFLSTVPPMDEIHFKCEGLHDGFYASIEYKCQIYHHCVYGIRHDFLCANFTAFDQRTFICHFASDVDCEGSQKYWNRNDALYMATTTTSTTTTTIAPPPTQPAAPRRRLQRPQRPLRRPYNRRPIDDYYYDEEDQYEDEYYERPTRRHKTRPRHRKPQLDSDYEEEYEVEKPTRRNRNRYRDEEESLDEDYEERPAVRRGKPTPGAAGRKNSPPRKPGRAEERRSFNEDRPLARRRSNEKRTTPSSAIDDLDEYEKPYGGTDQEEAAEEQTPQKVKTTPKPLTEFITPKAAAASVYARPRAPPKIARPVPITEKKKYSYPVQKNTATVQPPSGHGQDEEDYSQEQPLEDDYEQPPPPPPPPARNDPRRRTLPASRAEQLKPTRGTLRKPVTDKKPLEEDYEEPEPPRKRKRPLAPRSRAPAADVDFEDEDYGESPAPAPVATAAPARGNLRSRSKAATTTRKPIAPRPRQPIVEEEEDTAEPIISGEEETPSVAAAIAPRTRANSLSGRTAPGKSAQRPSSVRVVKRPFLPSRGGSPYLPRGLQPVGVALRPVPAVTTDSTPIDMGSTISGVRLLEHGAPLLRGRPDSSEDEAAEQDEEQEEEEDVEALAPPSPSPPRTTLPPRSALPATPKQQQQQPPPPKLNLDELYENDYDVTLNDALDPTLKPLSPVPQHQLQLQNSHPLPYQSQQQQQQQGGRPYASAYAAPASSAYNPFAYQQQYHPQQSSPTSTASASASASQSQSQQPASYHSDSYFSSTDIRRRAIVPSQAARSHRHEYAAPRGSAIGGGSAGAGGVSHHQPQMNGRTAQHFYDDFAY
ncbi:serine/arginine repetitive matrix protein 1 isoform X1 [Drosophila subobscura]|uniref:serine/arginine repetitive matrix protein 1 isoform X1 n=1 Tax=Drosophila subobscura TaxID=7241 RepID=UPI00155A19F0|nr:serine/arginine repetitive matrix protein 1 isoform X1 [Drosophila subobscura]